MKRALEVFAIAAMIALSGIACSSDGDSKDDSPTFTVQEYFVELERIARAHEESGNAQLPSFNEFFGSSDWASGREVMSSYASLLDAFYTEVGDLAAPEETADQQTEYVRAGKAGAAMFKEASSFEAEADANAYFEDLGERIGRELAAGLEACYDLERIAEEHDTEVDLGCGEL